MGASNASMDNPYVDMLKASGVTVIAIESDPVEIQAYSARFISLMNYIHSQGLKIHLITQMDTKTNLAYLGLTNPLQTLIPPSYTKVLNQEVAWARWLATAHPDYYSAIAEPSNLNVKMRVGFTTTQWTNIISAVTSTIKSVSPETQTWADLLPYSNIVDYYLGTSLVSVSALDGIGWDVYGPARMNIAQPLMITETNGGKLVGLTETWRYDLYAHPVNDTPTNAPYEAAWFSYAYRNMEGNGTIPSVFNSFFTNKFVSLAPLPTLPSQVVTWFDNLQTALDQGNRTEVFYGYQSLIMAR